MYKSTLTIFLILTLGILNAQEKKSSYSIFVEPELHFGKLVSNYSNFPKSDFTKSISLNIGIEDKRNLSASKFFNSPSTGIGLLYSDLNNDSILGHSFHVLPFIMFKPFARKQSKWWLKFGIGVGYFTKAHSAEVNNLAIGSKVTWSFQAYMYRDLYLTEKYDIRFGAGYLHSSNGHTKLPNMGLNSAQLSLAYRWKSKAVLSKKKYQLPTNESEGRKKPLFINIRTGLGTHEYGGKTKPIGGSNKLVYSLAVSGGIFLNPNVKLRSGLTYRFYQHYYDRLKVRTDLDLLDSPRWNASNIYFHVGCEFLTGHFGLDIEGGLNLFKPFYEHYYCEFNSTDSFKYQLKKHFVSRMGLNLYAINTNKMPRNNFFIGANINANFGQADFSEISLGYTYTFH